MHRIIYHLKILILVNFFFALSVNLALSQPCELQELYGVSRFDTEESELETNGLFSINPDTGIATFIGLTGFDYISGIDFDPATCRLYGVGFRPGECCGIDATILIEIDPCTGMGSEIGSLGLSLPSNNNLIPDISFRNSDSMLFAYSKEEENLKTIDITTGLSTTVGPSGLGETHGNGIAFSPGDTLFHAGRADEDLSTLNPDTGAGAFIADLDFSSIPAGTRPPRINAMDYQPNTQTLYVSAHVGSESGPTYLATLDTITGIVSNLGETVPNLDALAYRCVPPTPPTTAEVPALSEWGLIAMAGILGIVGFMVIRRRRVTA